MGHEVQVSEMGVPCSIQGIDKICIQDISCKSWKASWTWEGATEVDLTSRLLECDELMAYPYLRRWLHKYSPSNFCLSGAMLICATVHRVV
jgi:hypothetical protein